MTTSTLSRRVASALATLAAVAALSPLSTAEASTLPAVLGAGTVTIDESNPYMAGHTFRFKLAAVSLRDGLALGAMRVVHREPNSPRYSDLRLRVDCLRVHGRTAILSAETLSETTENGPVYDQIGFRVPVKITDGGANDRLVFGHGPPAPPDCRSGLFPNDVPTMPVLGDFRVR